MVCQKVNIPWCQTGLEHKTGFGIFCQCHYFIGLCHIFSKVYIVHFKIFGIARHFGGQATGQTIQQHIALRKNILHFFGQARFGKPKRLCHSGVGSALPYPMGHLFGLFQRTIANEYF